MEISTGAMKLNDLGDWIQYRVACECSHPECDAALIFELEEEDGSIIVTFYKKMRLTSYWSAKNWFHEKWLRICKAFRLLMTGVIEVEDDMIFVEGKNLETLYQVLHEGIMYLNIHKDRKHYWK